MKHKYLSKNQKIILELLTKENLTVKQIAIKKNVSKTAIYKTIRKLKIRGFINSSYIKSEKDLLIDLTNKRSKYYLEQKGNKDYRRRIRLKVLFHYGMICACCGEKNIEFLTIDHINNDGNEQRKTFKTDFYIWIIKNNYPYDLQVLCQNCNSAKNIYGYCPHKFKYRNVDNLIKKVENEKKFKNEEKKVEFTNINQKTERDN